MQVEVHATCGLLVRLQHGNNTTNKIVTNWDDGVPNGI